MADGKARKVFRGIGVVSGVRIGPVTKLVREERPIPRFRIQQAQIADEEQRLHKAIARAHDQLEGLKKRVNADKHPEHLEILNFHQLLLQDRETVDGTLRVLTEQMINVEWALEIMIEQLQARFEQLDDELFRLRGTDIVQVGDRVMACLHQASRSKPMDHVTPGSILIADDITPGEATRFYEMSMLGFATETGGPASHIAIIARSMNLCAVVGVRGLTQAVRNGDMVIMDGRRGLVILNPNPKDLQVYQQLADQEEQWRNRLLEVASLPAVTTDGLDITLRANLDSLHEIDDVAAKGLSGVGLFRTEFLFLDRDTQPTVEDHVRSTREILDLLPDDMVLTVRTQDLGADKMPRYWDHQKEDNPALGLRAVRTVQANPAFFVDQIKGILIGGAKGRVRILLPFISGLGELLLLRELIDQVKHDLDRAGIAYDKNTPLGAMIEIPSAAMMTESLAPYVDFFSVGTNDLVQYLLAADRDNDQAADYYQPLHPAVIRLLGSISQEAHKHGKPVSICGEIGGDPMYTQILLALGYTELSMTPGSAPVIKQVIRNTNRKECLELLAKVKVCATAPEIEDVVSAYLEHRFPEIFRK